MPPESLEDCTDQQINEWKTEYDVVTELRNAGHDVEVLGLYDRLGELHEALVERSPDIAFNLIQEFAGISAHDQHIAAYLELMRQPYTGCNPRGMMVSRDKVLSKQIFAWHGIPTPRFHVCPLGQPCRIPQRLRFPLFVKSAIEDASLGIAQASIVDNERQLQRRIDFIHESVGTDALVEEYIEGREFYVGVCGNERLLTLPVWEMDFGTLPQVMAGIATHKVKWDLAYQEKHGIRTGPAKALPETHQRRLGQLARQVYRVLQLSGYARMDFRMRPDGSLYVLEANCNPNLAWGEDFAESAESMGIDYRHLLHRILRLGLDYHSG